MKTFRISKLIGFLIGAVLVFLYRVFFVENLRWFIGGLVVLYGVLGILALALEKKKPIYEEHEFLFAAVEILIGLTLLAFIKEYATVCVVWAVWSILRESIELKEIVSGELHPVLAVISGLESIAVIVLSITLMMEPGEHHAMIHTYFLCLELTLSAIVPILNEKLPGKHHEEHKGEAA